MLVYVCGVGGRGAGMCVCVEGEGGQVCVGGGGGGVRRGLCVCLGEGGERGVIRRRLACWRGFRAVGECEGRG